MPTLCLQKFALIAERITAYNDGPSPVTGRPWSSGAQYRPLNARAFGAARGNGLNAQLNPARYLNFRMPAAPVLAARGRRSGIAARLPILPSPVLSPGYLNFAR
jgi:hypothetical protein